MSNPSVKSQTQQQIFDPSLIKKSVVGGVETAVVNLDKFQYMDSETVRRAIVWFQEMQEAFPSMRIQLEHVHAAVVRLLLVVRSVLPKQLEMISAYVPFFCDACSVDDESRLVTSADVRSPKGFKELVENRPNCPDCGLAMSADFDDVYFSLFKKNQTP